MDMRMSKQERIAIVVLAVIVILAVGVFVFIKPKFEAIGVSNTNLENVKTEYQAALDKQATKDGLKQQILDAYNAGETLADMFFTEMTTYQADDEVRAFLAQCKTNVRVNDISVSNPEVITLSSNFFTESEITYPLKSYATQGVEPTEEELAAQARQQILMQTLATPQEIGAISATIDVSTLSVGEFYDFCDEVNAYFKEEHGVNVRKALSMGGVSIEYTGLKKEYEELKTQIMEEAEDKGKEELYKNFGRTPPKDDDDNNTNTGTNTNANGAPQGDGNVPNPGVPANPNGEEEEEEELVVTDSMFVGEVTLTFYSVERMQDPTDQLDEQDGIAI